MPTKTARKTAAKKVAKKTAKKATSRKTSPKPAEPRTLDPDLLTAIGQTPGMALARLDLQIDLQAKIMLRAIAGYDPAEYSLYSLSAELTVPELEDRIAELCEELHLDAPDFEISPAELKALQKSARDRLFELTDRRRALKEAEPPAIDGMTSEELLAKLVESVATQFRCFGGGRSGARSPVSAAFEDDPPSFALGTSVTDVVTHVLSELEMLAMRPHDLRGLRDTIADMRERMERRGVS